MGAVTYLASHLYCGEAKPGQILVSQCLFVAVDELVEVEPVGERTPEGFLPFDQRVQYSL